MTCFHPSWPVALAKEKLFSSLVSAYAGATLSPIGTIEPVMSSTTLSTVSVALVEIESLNLSPVAIAGIHNSLDLSHWPVQFSFRSC